jgi:hypothetical protein
VTVTTKYHCNMCGVSSEAAELQALVFDGRDELAIVGLRESPMHICGRCKTAVRRFVEAEENRVE